MAVMALSLFFLRLPKAIFLYQMYRSTLLNGAKVQNQIICMILNKTNSVQMSDLNYLVRGLMQLTLTLTVAVCGNVFDFDHEQICIMT